jgi:hypothetical protein
MLPFIRRSWKTKTRTQSSERGIDATGKHDDLSGGCRMERDVGLLGGPKVMEQDCQLACYRYDGLVLRLFASTCCQV